MLSAFTIDYEFLGSARAFCRLQELHIEQMSNLEEWSGFEEAESLSCLRKLLTDQLSQAEISSRGFMTYTILRKLEITEADTLKEIKNLFLVIKLKIIKNRNLEILSHLPAIRSLKINNCPALRNILNLQSLRFLKLFNRNMEALPEWLGDIRQLQTLEILGAENLLMRCTADCPDWHKINHIPVVHTSQPIDSWRHGGTVNNI